MPVTPAELIRPEIRALAAYHVPSATGMIKLDAMENPFPWPGELRDAWLDRLRDASLNRYPDPGGQVLKARLREALDLPDGLDLLLGNGSDELIQLLALGLIGPAGERRCVLAPEPSFVMYRMTARFAGLDYVGVPLRADFGLDEDALMAAIGRHRPVLIYLAYPNNPTGNLFDRDAMLRIVAAAPGLVVIDEAYSAFADASLLDELPAHANLLVLRTVSKIGLAGLRLGYLVGAPDWLHEFDKLRLPYNINTLTQISVAFALEHRDLLDAQAVRLKQARGELLAALRTIPGITAYPSAANFILFRTASGRAGAVFEALRAQGILIKNLGGGSELLRDCLRVTVGSTEENRAFLAALRRVRD
jgi:histidinol-phosphate aminotransferase